MSKTNDRTGFLSLPTELRLQIASYALEQLPTDEERLIHLAQPWKTSVYNSVYKSSKNLAIRLVCREFNRDFSRLAIQKTTFVLYGGLGTVIDAQPDELLRDVRRLVIPVHRIFHPLPEFLFNRECLHLDELCLYDTLESIIRHRKTLIYMLRYLKNVKRVSFSADPRSSCSKTQRLAFRRLIGQILKEDHYQRYDSPNAPQPETTWWSWIYSNDSAHEFLTAQEPKPIMAEQDYMLLVKPKIDELMEQIELDQSVSQQSSPRERYTQTLLKKLPPSPHILELGCGPGIPTLRSLLDQGAHVVANDISTAHIQMAHRSCPEAKLLIGDMTALNFAPSTFHGAIGFYTLFHLPRSKLRGMLTKIHTWLKPGGVFAFNLATIDEEEIHGEVLGYGMFWSGYGVGHSRRLVEEVGFEVLLGEVVKAGKGRLEEWDQDLRRRFCGWWWGR
ncbi:O-methyltransferase [Pyrenophora tritici-repentis]|nr:O-methyltransferase [Pyrenophora tritici-repentis]